jgi:hypothetical protein
MNSLTRTIPKSSVMAVLVVLLSTILYGQNNNIASSKLPPLLDRDQEIAIARSAAPEEISKDASVFVLQRGGFVKAIDGKNGFTCLVLREGSNGTAPICYDAEGTQTILVAHLWEAEQLERGKSESEIQRAVAEGYKTGKFSAPRKPGLAYMMSKENHLHDSSTGGTFHYPPHVMIYAPYFKNSDIGATSKDRGSETRPWILNEGKPDAFIIVVPREKEE